MDEVYGWSTVIPRGAYRTRVITQTTWAAASPHAYPDEMEEYKLVTWYGYNERGFKLVKEYARRMGMENPLILRRRHRRFNDEFNNCLRIRDHESPYAPLLVGNTVERGEVLDALTTDITETAVPVRGRLSPVV